MNFILNNTHRKYMGLKPLKEHYEIMNFKGRYYDEYYVYFDGDTITKVIHYFNSPICISITENDVNYQTTENRTMVLPKTSKGKPRKLNYTAVTTFNGKDNYFYIHTDLERNEGYAIIGNYSNQRTYYKEEKIEDCNSLECIENWCDKFVEESTEEDLKEVEEFVQTKRKHIAYKEGDYFRVKVGRNLYTYGRLLMDVYKRQKKGMKYWKILMGRPLIIEIFYILTNRKDVTCEELSKLNTFPSQHIQDNNLYYGDFEIIGNGPLPEKIKYPIMYGKSIDATDSNKICFQCGKIYREIEYTKDNLIRREGQDVLFDFKNHGIGFNIDVKPKIIEKCIKENSEKSYWENSNNTIYDLRSPVNIEYLKEVLKQFNLEELYEIYHP